MDPQTEGTNGGNGQVNQAELRALTDSVLLERYQFMRQAGIAFGGARDYYEVFGYDRIITTKQYRDEYARGGVSKRIVECFPKATWRTGEQGVELFEDEDPEVSTPFEQAWNSINERLNVWTILQRADILAGLSSYSVLLIGAPGELDTELQKGNPDQLLFLQPFSGGGGPAGNQRTQQTAIDADATIAEFDIDPQSPRFGEPKTYQLKRTDIGGPALQKPVHWSRIIHIAEGCLDDNVYGQPTLENVWNLLMDLLKVTGGGAEAFWLRANQGLHLDIDKDMALPDAENAVAALKEQSENYKHQMTRWLRTRGVKTEVLGSDVANFENPAKAILTQIAGSKGIPMRILTGSEMGELASSQDAANFNTQVQDRRTGYAGPMIVRRLVDRLIKYGYLPTPAQYVVGWPTVETMTDAEKAKGAYQWAQTNSTQGSPVYTGAEIREHWHGLEPLSEEQEAEETEKLRPSLQEPEGQQAEEQGRTGQVVRGQVVRGQFPRAASEAGEEELIRVLAAAIESGATEVIEAIVGTQRSLQLPLAPHDGARLLVAALRRCGRLEVLGGPGSGNFGHAGRPGEVGGSTSDGGVKTFYHGTASQALDDIKNNGLVPRGSKGADAWLEQEGATVGAGGIIHADELDPDSEFYNEEFSAENFDPELGDRRKSVFITEDLELAKQYAAYAEKMNPGTTALVLQVDIPESYVGINKHGGFDAKNEDGVFRLVFDEEAGLGDSSSWRYNGKIPPEWIKGRVTDDGLKALASGGGKTIFVTLLVKDDSKAVGGQNVRALRSKSESPIHAAADRHVAKLSVAFRYAFAEGRRVIKGELRTLGGPGSGNFGHTGRPGEVGGSAESNEVIDARVKEIADIDEWVEPNKVFGGKIDYPGNLDADLENDSHSRVIPLKQLVATQDYTSVKKAGIIAKGGSRLEVHVSYVDGKWAILDGHHNAVAAFLRGNDSVRVRAHARDLRNLADGSIASRASAAISNALNKVLPPMLLKVAAEGGEAALGMLERRLRTAGGPGSGNFGHAGRPGEVGGSGTTAFHGTSGEHVRSILRQGISSNYAGSGSAISSSGVVYASSSLERAQQYAEDRRHLDGDIAVFELLIPAEEMEKIGKTTGFGGHTIFSYAGSFKPEWIKSVRTRTKGSDEWKLKTLAENDASAIVFVPVIFEVVTETRDLAGRSRVTFGFNRASPAVIRWAKEHAAELIADVAETTRERIKDAIARKVESGTDTIDEILKAIGDEDRAELIARHETHLAASEGQRQAWDQATDKGLLSGDEQRTWITTPDQKLCPICEELEGQTAKLGGEYPGGIEGPPAHVACRCTEGLT